MTAQVNDLSLNSTRTLGKSPWVGRIGLNLFASTDSDWLDSVLLNILSVTPEGVVTGRNYLPL